MKSAKERLEADAVAASIAATETVEALDIQVAVARGLEDQLEQQRKDAADAAASANQRIVDLEAELMDIEGIRAENNRLRSEADVDHAASEGAIADRESEAARLTDLESELEQVRSAATDAATAASLRIEHLEAEVSGIENLRTDNERLVAEASAQQAVTHENQSERVTELEAQIAQLRSDEESRDAEALDVNTEQVADLEHQIERLQADAAKANERVENLEAELARADERQSESEHVDEKMPANEIDQHDFDDSHDEPISDEVYESLQESREPAASTGGTSLSDRIKAAEVPSSLPEEDSLDAIRSEAMLALEEARSIKDQPQADEIKDSINSDQKHVAVSRPAMDYSPSVPAPVNVPEEDEKEEEEDQPVESRYSRNSAKLPRLGIEPDSASDTIANLRKQMTLEN